MKLRNENRRSTVRVYIIRQNLNKKTRQNTNLLSVLNLRNRSWKMGGNSVFRLWMKTETRETVLTVATRVFPCLSTLLSVVANCRLFFVGLAPRHDWRFNTPRNWFSICVVICSPTSAVQLNAMSSLTFEESCSQPCICRHSFTTLPWVGALVLRPIVGEPTSKWGLPNDCGFDVPGRTLFDLIFYKSTWSETKMVGLRGKVFCPSRQPYSDYRPFGLSTLRTINLHLRRLGR